MGGLGKESNGVGAESGLEDVNEEKDVIEGAADEIVMCCSQYSKAQVCL